MNNTSDLITTGLGYCCEWHFFQRYRDARLIAARLGITERTVRQHLYDALAGKVGCTDCKRCVKRRPKA